MLATAANIKDDLACPRCRGPLNRTTRGNTVSADWVCATASCGLSASPFPSAGGQPALVDFQDSILDRAVFVETKGASYSDRDPSRLASVVTRLAFGRNRVVEAMVPRILADLKALAARPKLLMIGGGTVGNGAQALYADSAVSLIGTDIYPSRHTTLVADAHHLPFADGTIDGVWVQAVLEHVLDPRQVVAEIHRVLRPDGLVFADTPFMQQVHEGAYDFTRFTLSGHRWLFRHFALIDAGITGGAGMAALWSMRYLVRAVTGSGALGTLLQLPFFWLRYADRITSKRPASADAASAVYFYGRRSETLILPKDIVTFYDALHQARGLS